MIKHPDTLVIYDVVYVKELEVRHIPNIDGDDHKDRYVFSITETDIADPSSGPINMLVSTNWKDMLFHDGRMLIAENRYNNSNGPDRNGIFRERFTLLTCVRPHTTNQVRLTNRALAKIKDSFKSNE